MKLENIWRNWTVHNLLSHPLSEMVYLVVKPFSAFYADKWSGSVHNFSVPMDFEDGRG